jgi:hypothetical protein
MSEGGSTAVLRSPESLGMTVSEVAINVYRVAIPEKPHSHEIHGNRRC